MVETEQVVGLSAFDVVEERMRNGEQVERSPTGFRGESHFIPRSQWVFPRPGTFRAADMLEISV